MEKSDSVRLKHMLEAARTCLQFGTGKGRIDFETDQMLSFAVIRRWKFLGKLPQESLVSIKRHIPTYHGEQ